VLNVEQRYRFLYKPVVFIASLLPLAWMLCGAFGWLGQSLGPDPVKRLEHFCGQTALNFLMGTLAVMNVLLSSAFVPCINYTVARAGAGDRALVSTIMLASSGLIGGALGPFVVGALSDAFAPQVGTEGLRYGLAAMIASPILATAFLFVAIRQAPGIRPARARPE